MSNDTFDNKTSKVLYLPNISGLDMFNAIRFSKKTIAIHGTITLLGNLLNVPILDLFYCDIKNRDDFYRYKNAFHEFKPKLNNYEFIIPKRNLEASIKKIRNIISNGRKINY